MTDGRDDDLHAERAFRPGPPPELREPPRRSRALGIFVATFALAAFSGVVWYAYDQGLRRGTETTAPLIKADPRPAKLRPDQPGGLQVPNQDKLVYEAMRPGDAESPKVERLLPPPERPMAPPPPPPPPIPQAVPSAEAPVPPPAPATVPPVQQPASTASVAPTAPTAQAPAGQAPAGQASPEAGIPPARIVTPAPAPVIPRPDDTPAAPVLPRSDAPAAPSAAPPPPATTPTPAPVGAAEPPKPAPAAKPAPPAAKPVPTTAGNFRIQLGALRELPAAEAEWNRLKRRHADELGSLDHRIQTVDLGPGKGIFYRIQSSGVSEASANAICAALKAKSQPCIVVKP